MKRHITTKVRISLDHHAVTTVLGAGLVVDDLGHTMKAQSMEEHEYPGPLLRHTTKKRWEHRALLAEFAPHQYPNFSNYPMISKSTMDLRSHNHGSQIICKQSKY
jgi:hypothetical protein